MTDSTPSAPPSNVFQRWGRRGTAAILTACALVLLLIGATAGIALSPERDSPPDAMANNSVDVGFLRDMTTHHNQAIVMANFAIDHTADSDIKVFARDLEYTQTAEIGTMNGWLTLWEHPLLTLDEPMLWMADSGGHGSHGMSSAPMTMGTSPGSSDEPLMPGMATVSEMATLQGLTGPESDKYFLQLMIRHHQGGTPMMQYVIDHGSNRFVKQLAQRMLNAQNKEVVQMTDWLDKEFKAKPLPFTG